MTQTSERRTTRTNIVLGTDLVETAMHMTGLRTRWVLVDHALCELIRREQQMQLLDLSRLKPSSGPQTGPALRDDLA